MARLRFADVQSRPTEFLDFTSLTLDEFHRKRSRGYYGGTHLAPVGRKATCATLPSGHQSAWLHGSFDHAIREE
jgi:hypothetical protein